MFSTGTQGYKDHAERSSRRSSRSLLSPTRITDIMKNTGVILARKLTVSSVLLGILVIATFVSYLSLNHLSDLIFTLTECKKFSGAESSREGRTTVGIGKVKRFAVHGNRVDSGYLKHVFETFVKLGYTRVNHTEEWDVLWSHDYPFRVIKDQISNLKPSQKVNHFPGSGYITNKMNLATSDLPYVPKAFQLPKDKDKLLQYAKVNPHKRFVQKSNNHRGIRIEKLEKLDLTKNSTFIQEYISNPLLIDGHKFDIGVYTVLTSIHPLRVYIYRDVLFRFCPESYHPFDPDVVDKYVVGDDYLPMWKVPSLSKLYNDLGFGMKDSFNGWYTKTKEKPSDPIWAQVEAAIRTIYLRKEQSLIDTTKKFTLDNGRNFFEMVRFDFVIDDEGKVFIMEANMSPNLSSAHFPPNQLLYEQVLFNILGLVGVGSSLPNGRSISDPTQVSPKHLAVFPLECQQEKCLYDCQSFPCNLCHHCLNEEVNEALKLAYLDQVNRGDCIRVFPPNSRFNSSILQNNGLTQETLQTYDTSKLNKINKLEVEWFKGKCLIDEAFC